MARPGRPTPTLVLTNDERWRLEASAYSIRDLSRSLRCRIVLRCAEGFSNRQVAKLLGVSPATVSKWRWRFAARRLEGLHDAPRSGVPRSITDVKIEAIVAATLERTAPDAKPWTIRSMAKESGISTSSVSRIWRAHGLDPHRINIFQLSSDPVFMGKVQYVEGLYLHPPEGALALCVDEQAGVPAAAPMVAPRSQMADPRSDDGGNGLTELHRALEAAWPLVHPDEAMAEVIESRRVGGFLQFLDGIDQDAPEGFDVYVIVGFGATKKTPEIQRWLEGKGRFHFQTAPTYRWWMRLVGRWFALADEGAAELVASIDEWIETWIEDPIPFTWY